MPTDPTPSAEELATLSPEEREAYMQHVNFGLQSNIVSTVETAFRDLMRLRLAARRTVHLEDAADRYYIAALELCHLFEDLGLMQSPVLWKCYEDARFAAEVHAGNKGGDELVDTRGARAKAFADSDACKARWAMFYEAHRESFGEASRASIEAAERYQESVAAKNRLAARREEWRPRPFAVGDRVLYATAKNGSPCLGRGVVLGLGESADDVGLRIRNDAGKLLDRKASECERMPAPPQDTRHA